MNGKGKRYLILQLKRGLKLLPQMLSVTLLLGLCAALAGIMLSSLNREDSARQKIEIGIVGDTADTYLSIGISAIEHMDSSRFSVRLTEMEEGEAKTALFAGKLTGYLVIPEHFVEGMYSGEHHPITYVTSADATGFGTIVAEELVTDISQLLLETENAIYGAQSFAALYGGNITPYEAGNALIGQYMRTVLNRDRLFAVETIGTADYLSFEGYYLCGVMVALLLFWGISCSPLFSRRSAQLSGMLKADGLGAARQILCEFAAFGALILLAVLCITLPAGAALPRLGIRIPELIGLRRGERLLFCLRLIPVSMMLSSVQFLLYELFPGTVGGILLQFVHGVVQGYLAGCFYPAAFLPDGMRRLGEVLPAGVAMDWMEGGLLGQMDPWQILALLGYTLLSLLLAAFVRQRKLSR